MISATLHRYSCLVLLSLLWLGGSAHAADETIQNAALYAEINHILDSSVTDLPAAIVRLNLLYKRETVTISLENKRAVLAGLVDMDLRNQKYDEARHFNAILAVLAKTDLQAKVLVLNFQAALYQMDGKADQARVLIGQALVLADQLHVPAVTSLVNAVAGYICQDLGDSKAALNYLLVSLENAQGYSVSEEFQRATTFNMLGTLYQGLKNPQLAMEYFDKATKIADTLHANNLLVKLEINRGTIFADLGNIPAAGKSYLSALEMARKIADKKGEMVALNNLSDMAFTQQQYVQCVRYANQTHALARERGDKEIMAAANINSGLCHMGLGFNRFGVSEVALGIEFMRNADARPELEAVLGQLALAYEKSGLYKQAFETISEQRKLSLELFSIDRDRAVAEIKARFDAKEGEKQLELLEQKNRRLSIESANKSLQQLAFILASVIAAALSVFIFNRYRQIREVNHALQEENIQLENKTHRDPLTGLLNRRAFHDVMQFRTRMKDRRSREAGVFLPHALIILDIDYFKLVNDTYGHAGGDIVLKEISQRLSLVMREQDMLMRWGGEEFLVFLNHTSIENFTQVIERILTMVGSTSIALDEQSVQVTISAGFIALPPGADGEIDANWEKSLHLADSALYMAKTRGRNRAIGIKAMAMSGAELDVLLAGDLEKAIREGRVAIEQIEGPVMTKK